MADTLMANRVLVGDIGGTNARFAIAAARASGAIELSHVAVMQGDDFASFDAALKHYISGEDITPPRQALIALSGPVADGKVKLTHRDWLVDRRALEADIGFDLVRLVNDYAAMARAIPQLSESNFRVLHAGRAPDAPSPILVAGPGTGLGIATLLPTGEGGWQVITGEGGQAAFAARNAREWQLVEQLRQAHGFVSNELLTAGIGLEPVHRALCEIDGVEWRRMMPDEIIRRAKSGDQICQDICDIRAAATLAALGDAALTNGTLGGVVITGGVAEHLADWLVQPKVLERFFERGIRRDYMLNMPIRLLQSGQAPLIGAAALYFDENGPA